jgi:hypothetical protein
MNLQEFSRRLFPQLVTGWLAAGVLARCRFSGQK